MPDGCGSLEELGPSSNELRIHPVSSWANKQSRGRKPSQVQLANKVCNCLVSLHLLSKSSNYVVDFAL